MIKKILTIITLLFSVFSFSQLNQIDSQKRKQGAWEVYHSNSATLKYKGQFKDNKPTGVFTYYYESNKVKAKVKYLEFGRITYSQVYHESSGRIKAMGKYINQKKDSTWTYFDNVGNVKSKEAYKNGKLNGQRVIYYEPIDGKYVVSRFEYYKDDLLHGTFKEYHQNTKLRTEGNYKDGNFDGDIKYYYPNGKMERLERYRFAVKHGWWIFFDQEGNQVGTRLFWEGNLLEGKALETKKAELKANR